MKIFKYTLLLLILFFISRLLAQPNPPENLTGTSTKFEYQNITVFAVRLNWDKIKDANNVNVPIYRVYKKLGEINSNNEFSLLAEVLWNNVYSDKEVEPGITYSYYVTAVDNNGLESTSSNRIEVFVKNDPIGGSNSSISGFVKDEITNNPLGGVWVSAISTTNLSVKSELTDATGAYKIDLLPDEYIVHFKANQDYFPEFFDNVKNANDATRITLPEGENLTDIDAYLTPISSLKYFSLSGTVKNAEENPLHAIVTLLFLNDEAVPFHQRKVETNSMGEFSFSLREGSKVVVHAEGIGVDRQYYGEFYNDAVSIEEAEKIIVNEDITGINFILDSKFEGNSTIKGFVFNKDNNPIQAMVIAIKLGAERWHMLSNLRAFTDNDGSYSFEGLIPGDYILFVIPEIGYAPTFFKFDSTTTIRWRNADILSLNENDIKEDINFYVSAMPDIPTNAFAEIRVRLRNNFGEPFGNALVYALDNEKNVVSYGYSNQDGEIKFALSPGFYSISTDNYGLTYEESTNVLAGVNDPTYVDFTLSEDKIVSVDQNTAFESFKLFQNYPNPFNPSTVIEFTVPNNSFVSLKIYDVLGKEVKTLINDQLGAGNYKVNFDASDLTSGIYFYKLETNTFSKSKKMILLR